MPSNLWKTPQIHPTVVYDDIPKAIEWLSRIFGFRERTEARLTGTGFTLAWLEYGDGLIGLTTPSPQGASPKKIGKITQSVKVYVDDVDQHFKHAKAAGAAIASELADGFWGGRFYRAIDCEGHTWEFSQLGKDLAAEDWKVPPGIKRGA
jgi:uncharacterized glyoxalase superfamily protein PhnB